MSHSFFQINLIRAVVLGLSAILAACSPGGNDRTTVAVSGTYTPTAAPSRTPLPVLTSTETPAPATAVPTSTPIPTVQVCSPLREIQKGDLSAAIVNPFRPPPPGSDDFHQGVDLGDLDPINRIALTGRPVQAVLAGRVAAIVEDKFPYGNAVLIETDFEALPPSWFELFNQPTPVASPVVTNLSCPVVDLPAANSTGRSLYILYAHLEDNPDLTIDGLVACGVKLGSVGSSGNALNPHLHLELRVGPSGAFFPSMAHYDTTASPEEMASYCSWRVGGAYLILDPMTLFAID